MKGSTNCNYNDGKKWKMVEVVGIVYRARPILSVAGSWERGDQFSRSIDYVVGYGL